MDRASQDPARGDLLREGGGLPGARGYRLLNRTPIPPPLTPSFVFELTAEQNKTIESMSFLVLIEMQRQQIIQPISLIATCLLYASGTQYAIDLTSLVAQCQSLKRLLNNLGVKVYWPLTTTTPAAAASHDEQQMDEMEKAKALVLYTIESHLNLFNLFNKTNGSTNLIENVKLASQQPIAGCSQFVLSIQTPCNTVSNQTGVLENASIYLAVCSYKNQLVNFLIRVSFVCNCLLANAAAAASGNSLFQLGRPGDDTPFKMYSFLSVLFNREFML